MVYVVFCNAYSTVIYLNMLNVSLGGLITSVGEERADFSATDYSYFSSPKTKAHG